MNTHTLNDSRFLRACRKQQVDRTPVWLMRQAGRYMAEYRAIREKFPILNVIKSPELAAEVTLQPINAFDLDAAIIFSDILPPLTGMGFDVDFVAGKGPVIRNPIKTTRDIDLLGTPPAEVQLSPTLEAVRIVSTELSPRGIPLIGFAGAPFTMASYAIEGGGSKDFAKTKGLMYAEPAAWKRLMEKFVTIQADYLLKQAKAGASALQVFDSRVGLALGREAYQRFVAPYNTQLLSKLKAAEVPVIHFGFGTSAYLDTVAECGGDVIGIDFKLPLAEAWEKVADHQAVQGNLDPMALLAPWREVRYQADQVLGHAAGRVGHIFNLGHGIHKNTPVDNVRRLVDYIHEMSAGNRG